MRHSHATIAAILVLALLAGGCASGSAFKQGDTAARAGDWDAAAEHYRRAVQDKAKITFRDRDVPTMPNEEQMKLLREESIA